MHHHHHTDILIVGAGPTGLTMALELALHGVPFRIVDKAPAPTDKSKALVLQARSLELLSRHAGLGAQLVAAGNTASGASVVVNGKETVRLNFDELATRVRGGSAHSMPVIISQCDTEAVLLRCLRDKYGVSPEWGVAVRDTRQDDTGVSVTLDKNDSQDESSSSSTSSSSAPSETIRVKYVVGADGAHSVVRHSSPNMTFDGAPYPQDFILCDAYVGKPSSSPPSSSSSPPKPSTDRFYICLGQGLLVILPLKEPGMVRLVACRAGHRQQDSQPTLADFQSHLDAMFPGFGELRDPPAWMTRYRLHHRVVSRYRDGRLFVAGDAAHIHSPAGGQGMNTGIQDAVNLGWKLAAAAAAVPSPSSSDGKSDGMGGISRLLDSYDAERRPAGQKLLDSTDRVFSWMTWDNPAYLYLRNTLVPWIAPLVAANVENQVRHYRFVSQFGIRYRRSALVGTADGFVGPVLGGDRAPDGLVKRGAVSGSEPGAGSLREDDDGGDDIDDDDDEGRTYLLANLKGDRHNLVLFSGAGTESTTTHQALQAAKDEFLAAVEEKQEINGFTNDKVPEVHIVYSCGAAKSLEVSSWSSSSKGIHEYIDVDGNEDELHARYGFGVKAGYVYVRPDFYVAHVGYLSSLSAGDLLERL